MRRLRFSIKRLLILVAIVGVSLYVFVLRPTIVANQFIQKLKTTTDLRPISEKYFGGETVEGGILIGQLDDCDLEPRTRADIFACRQRFTIRMWSSRGAMISYNCYSTPFATKFKNHHYSIISPTFLFPDSAREKSEILAKTRAVKKGDRIKDVVKHVAQSYSTEPYEIGEGSDKYGARLIYNLTDSHGVYEDIVFWFGNDDRLVKVTTSTVERPFAPPRKLRTEEIELEVH